MPSGAGRVLIAVGLVLTAFFFATVPVSPLSQVLAERLGGIASLLEEASGLLGLVLFIAGYTVYKLERFQGEERVVAVYDIAHFYTLLAYMVIIVFFYNYIGGLRGVITGVIAGIPWVYAAYRLILKRLGEKSRRVRIKIVYYRIEGRKDKG